jgi:hypothetical protein
LKDFPTTVKSRLLFGLYDYCGASG